MKPEILWVLLRLTAIAVMSTSILVIPSQRSNLDWTACFLIATIVAISLYLWLRAIRFQTNRDWSQPYSLRKPFLPMNKFPLRFWFTCSFGLVIGGGVAMGRDIIEHNGHEAVGGTFVFVGLLIAVALKLWLRSFSSAV